MSYNKPMTKQEYVDYLNGKFDSLITIAESDLIDCDCDCDYVYCIGWRISKEKLAERELIFQEILRKRQNDFLPTGLKSWSPINLAEFVNDEDVPRSLVNLIPISRIKEDMGQTKLLKEWVKFRLVLPEIKTLSIEKSPVKHE